MWMVVGASGVAVWVLGIVGFSQVRGSEDGALDLAYRSLQLFSFEGGDRAVSPPVALEFARFLAPIFALLFVAVVVRSLVQLFRNERLIRVGPNHVIVCGMGRSGAGVASALARQGAVVGITLDESNPGVARARNDGVKVIRGDAGDLEVLRRARIARAEAVIVLCADDTKNAEIAATVTSHSPGTRVVVGVRDRRLADQLHNALSDNHAIDPVNLPAEAAKRMIRKAHINEGPAHALIVGFGSLGQAVAAGLAEQSRVHDLYITAVDRDAPRKEEAVRAEVAALSSCGIGAYALEFVSQDFEQLTFLEELQPVSAVFVCVGDEALAVTLGLQLRRASQLPRSIPIVVRVNEEGRGLASLLTQRAAHDGVSLVGMHDGARELVERLGLRQSQLTGSGNSARRTRDDW